MSDKRVIWFEDHLHGDQLPLLQFAVDVFQSLKIGYQAAPTLTELGRLVGIDLQPSIRGIVIDTMVALKSGETDLSVLGAEGIEVDSYVVGREIVKTLFSPQRAVYRVAPSLVRLANLKVLVLSTLEVDLVDWGVPRDAIESGAIVYIYKHDPKMPELLRKWLSQIR